MADNRIPRYRREAFILSVHGVRAQGGAPGLKIRFCDRGGAPFTLSNGFVVNPSPTLTIFKAMKGDTEKNDEINKEHLARLGYKGDFVAAPTVQQFTSGITRSDPVPVEITWEVTEYGNEVISVRSMIDEDEDGSAFFTGAPPKKNKKSKVEGEPSGEAH